MYHISDIKKYKKCPRFYYLSKENEIEYIPFLRNDEALTELVIKKLKIDNYFLGERGDEEKRVLDVIDDYEWYIKARFSYNGLRIKAPILHRVDDGFDVYFLLFALYPHEEDAEYYRYNLWVLENNNIKIRNIYVLHLNANYVYQDQLDVDGLFVISDSFYNAKNQAISNIKDKIYQKDIVIDDVIKEIDINSLETCMPHKSRMCKTKNMCNFYQLCFPNEEELEDDSILTLVSSRHKNKMYENGIRLLKDADPNLIEGSRVQYAQIMASKLGGLYYDQYPLKTWLNKLAKRPLVFIDFEWERYLVPQFKGLKPYDVVCFEYSIHELDCDGNLIHKDFIGTKDCRLDFIKSLLNDVPKDAILVAYNAEGAEVLRIKELAAQFKEFEDDLLDIANRFVDMSFPFLNGMIYHTKMRGNFSVKSLLNVVSDLNYKDLSINNGMDAVVKWRLIDRDTEQANLDVIKQDLLEYCSLDSYSLYLIYTWLCNLVTNL